LHCADLHRIEAVAAGKVKRRPMVL